MVLLKEVNMFIGRFVCGPTAEEVTCECYNEDSFRQRLVTPQTDDNAAFQKCKEEFKRQVNFTGVVYRYLAPLSS